MDHLHLIANRIGNEGRSHGEHSTDTDHYCPVPCRQHKSFRGVTFAESGKCDAESEGRSNAPVGRSSWGSAYRMAVDRPTKHREPDGIGRSRSFWISWRRGSSGWTVGCSRVESCFTSCRTAGSTAKHPAASAVDQALSRLDFRHEYGATMKSHLCLSAISRLSGFTRFVLASPPSRVDKRGFMPCAGRRPRSSARTWCFCAIAIFSTVVAPAVAEIRPAPGRPGPGPILKAALDGPLAGCDEIVFAQRVSGRDHWYGNFGHYCETESPYSNHAILKQGDMRYAFGDGGRLCRLNLRTGKLQVLLDDPAGGIRDPDVHYDGKRILFSYRRGGTTTYHPPRNRYRRQEPQATHRRPGQRHRAHLHAGRGYCLLFESLSSFRAVLADPGGHALSLRWRRQEHPHAVEQRRTGKHAMDAARRTNPLHAMGIRRPAHDAVPPPLDDQSGRHECHGLLRQSTSGRPDDRRETDPRHPAWWWPRSLRGME